MNIGILGLGVIGSACKYGFEKLGHNVFVHDPKLETRIEEVLYTDIVYVCVPTPSRTDGSCDTSIVEKCVHELIDLGYDGIIAIKSTVIPGTTMNLIYETTNEKICFVPEFLRERCAITDFIENHDLLAVGTVSSDVYNMIVECHGKYPKNHTILTPSEAEILKYYSNIFNAMKIIFANEMYEICNIVGANYSKIKDAFIKRGTAKDIYLDVNDNFRGYGGQCLPKDTLAMSHFVNENGLDLKLFETIHNENKKFKTTVFDGMRKE